MLFQRGRETGEWENVETCMYVKGKGPYRVVNVVVGRREEWNKIGVVCREDELGRGWQRKKYVVVAENRALL